MFSSGAEIRWRDGNIILPLSKWKSPSKRRIPRLLVEHRALEVGILIYIEKSWIIFKESDLSIDQIKLNGGQKEVKSYQRRYHLLPSEIEGEDSFVWLSKSGNRLLLFNKNGKYFVKSS